ncbi:lysophospholipid acyltransferase family protein [Streptomyces antimicrobicus]|uniref:1-acyl-sn-glycerol-3-phosphate acyltransferase n=1 Tax=Streptomyces antimicrobicus TaxID=2883108 RepID=A0ABS8B8E0_9ACTN|nr:1-acyl-sn-glycerol-3-phosphate acyltransferase [Streptomyces antimicrobicus]MCB5180847.1 1-acyl-sn-glycerol-3-phosphate acyltransferase [Streptomyces antimicrobicus]
MSESKADVVGIAGGDLRFLRGLLGSAGEDAWERLLEWFVDDWFRLDVLGLDNVPAEGPAVLVANHSGAWGLDAFVLQKVLSRSLRRRMHTLAAPFLFRLPLLGAYAAKKGAVPSDLRAGMTRLADGELLVVFPEGVSGLEKPFRDRYRLQPFNPGFAVAAVHAGAPVVPVSVIGAEESVPKVGELPALARLLDLPSFPLTSPFPLPAKWLITIGEPIAPPERPRAAGARAAAARRLCAEVQVAVQELVDRERQRRDTLV